MVRPQHGETILALLLKRLNNMRMKMLVTKFGLIRSLLLVSLLVCSWCLFVIRTMWLYESPFIWWAYQGAHLFLFCSAIFYFLCFSKYKALINFIVSILIGFMPYDLWFSLAVNFSNENISGVTDKLPLFARVIFEFCFYPTLEFLLLLIAIKLTKGNQ